MPPGWAFGVVWLALLLLTADMLRITFPYLAFISMTALAGSEGLQKAREEKPQLIVFGFDLFDMTAPEFCRAFGDYYDAAPGDANGVYTNWVAVKP